MSQESTTSSGGSLGKVRLISQSTTRPQDDPRAGSPQQTLPVPVSPRSRADFLEQMLAVQSAIAQVVASRILMLLSVAGGFVLAYMAIQAPDLAKIGVCLAYYVGVIAPVTWLYLRG